MKATASPKDPILLNVSKPWISVPRNRAVDQVFSNSPNVWHWMVLVGLAFQVFPAVHPLLAQSLRLSAATASRGQEVAIEVSLESPAGKEPLAVQWDTGVPAAIHVVDCSLPGGTEMQGLGKTLRCAAIGKSSEVSTSRCILAGGQKTIPNGPVALLRLKISREAQPGSARVRLGQVTAVSGDLKQIPISPVETTVTIRK